MEIWKEKCVMELLTFSGLSVLLPFDKDVVGVVKDTVATLYRIKCLK